MDHKDDSGNRAGMSASTIVSNDTDEPLGDELDDSLKALTNQTMRRFGPYPAYKDSDVEWLGDIPTLWETMRLKYLVDFRGGGTPPKEILEYWRGDIPWVSPKDMKVSVIVDTEDKITAEAVRVSATNFIPLGAVVIVVRSGILGHSIPAAVTGREVTLNQDLKALIPRCNITAKFLRYFICGMQRQLLTAWRKEGATVESLELDLVASSYAPVPPLEDQRSITTFLDRETTKIDALVAKKERLIELLQEKRTSLATHAVTKGLDLNVPMKDLGVEWLQDIPAHWNVLNAGRLIRRIEQGWSPVAEDRQAEVDEWAVIKLSAVSKGSFVSSEHKALPAGLSPDTRYEVRDGDFLLTRANTPELVGDVCVVRCPRSRLMLCDLVYRLDLRCGQVDQEFLAYWLLSRSGRHQIEVEARGASQSMVKISQGVIRAWTVIVPPLLEQRNIVVFLDRQTAQIDALVSTVCDATNRLKEFRATLISAAVTGQIDVREEAT